MKPTPAIETRDDGTVWIRVRVQPKASRDAFTLDGNGRIRVTLCAPPVDGAANAALCAYFAKMLGTAKTNVTVIKGEKSREKVIAVEGIDTAHILKKLKGE